MLKFHPSLPALTGLFVAVTLSAATQNIVEDFSSDPVARGWKTFGDASLFHWNATDQNLEVTWDSRQSNSYFLRPLGTILSKHDDFSLAFDLRLADVTVGVDPAKPYSFQLVVGFVNRPDATRTGFLRGTGTDSPNVVEFDYFPDSGFGATVAPTIISSNQQFATSFNFPLELTSNDWFHIEMTYTASNATLATVMTRNGQPFGPISDATQGAGFSDFRVDHIAVCSYSDAGQDPQYGGSILARGVVDNIVIVTPPPAVANLAGGFVDNRRRVRFTSQAGWLYTLERTADFGNWQSASETVNGTGGEQVLEDSGPLASLGFYRVRAERP